MTKDYAEFCAAMSIAIADAQSTTGPITDANDSIETALARVSACMAKSYWQIAAAERMQISPKMWLYGTWHCWQLRRLAAELLNSTGDEAETQIKFAKFARYFVFVEFGVNVSPSWHRRFREAIADGRTTRSELRSLLGKPTVWWGTKHTHGQGFLGQLYKLCAVGRPNDGDLLVQHFHPVTRVGLTLVFIGSCIGVAYGLSLLLQMASPTGRATQDLFVVLDCTTAMIVAAVSSWWAGPSSSQAVDRLREILNDQNVLRL
ncbi:MAG: hypothetical protein CFE43_20920 [Burkholderiales bacterium PBB3]|nr:MAG: hypothetical protein CFE43_20920 [Burkholderiales bacterium PBB3]